MVEKGNSASNTSILRSLAGATENFKEELKSVNALIDAWQEQTGTNWASIPQEALTMEQLELCKQIEKDIEVIEAILNRRQSQAGS